MPTYITLYRYTQQGIKNIKKSPHRVDEARKAIEKAGAKLKAIYLTMGQYDLIAVSEWPNEESAAAFLLGQGAQGNVSSESLRAFSEEEFKSIVAKIG